ncbi:dihydrolipoamide acetyltransferase family protein [Immundisolibacter sp.]|uniref:dihydrolipoamide acetyltransferase family protein n=1 Tax=Immundisolibacter sp. TaxID=1934948 RepID=UPI00356184BF
MADFCMPSLGSDMESGTLVEWRIRPGDRVHRGDIVAVVETQKGAIDVEIFDSGVVDTLVVQPGTEVPVGTVLATVHGEAEAATRPAAPKPAAGPPEPTPTAPPPVAEAPVRPAPAAAGPAPVRASPVARRQAAERGIDLTAVSGSGPGGAVVLADLASSGRPAGGKPPRAAPSVRQRALELDVDLAGVAGSGPKGAITVADVERAAGAPPAPAAAPRAPFEPDAMRRAIAAAMTRAKREIPHYYLSTTADFEPALRFIETVNAERDPDRRLLYAVVLLKATALALREVPELNGFWRHDRFEPSTAVHIGVAVALRRRGLIAPALHDVADKDLDTLMDDLKDLVQRARAGGLRSSELTDPTITLSSLGDNGVESVYPIITPPQVAVVGAGSVVRRPWVVGEGIAVRRTVTLTLAGDHRVSDGHRGALFLAALDRLLHQPEAL